MALLSATDRRRVRHGIMRDLSSRWEPLPLTKPELRDALAAVDGWIDANGAAFNAALPAAARSALSARQKVLLLAAVLSQRMEVL